MVCRGEHREQVAVFEWLAWKSNQIPQLKNAFAIPNAGLRSYKTAAYLKAEGLTPGVPDIFIAVPCGKHAGLFIEMKIKPNKPSPLQLEWQNRLNSVGYRAEICYGSSEAIALISRYLEGK